MSVFPESSLSSVETFEEPVGGHGSEPCTPLSQASLSSFVHVPEDLWQVTSEYEELSQWVVVDTENMEKPKKLQICNAASGVLLAAPPITIGTNYLSESEGFAGDVTACWEEVLKGFPSVKGVYSLGRLAVPPRAPGVLSTRHLPAMLHAIVYNDGDSAWPEGTALRIVAGNSYGFDCMHIGVLPPGCAADLNIDVVVQGSDSMTKGGGVRSAWVLTDNDGMPFGPVLALEVMWL